MHNRADLVDAVLRGYGLAKRVGIWEVRMPESHSSRLHGLSMARILFLSDTVPALASMPSPLFRTSSLTAKKCLEIKYDSLKFIMPEVSNLPLDPKYQKEASDMWAAAVGWNGD